MRKRTLSDFESDHSLSEIPLWGFAYCSIDGCCHPATQFLSSLLTRKLQVQHRAEKGLAVVSVSGKTSLDPLMTLLLLKDTHEVDDVVS